MPIVQPIVPSWQFAALLKVQSVRWHLREFIETSGTAIGDVLTSEIAAPKWTAEIQLSPVARDEGQRTASIMRRIGAHGRFDLFNPARRYPVADPDGSVLGAAVVTVHNVGARALRLQGLPNGYRLQWGDLVSITYGSDPVRRALFEVSDDVITQPAGITPWFEVTPPVKAGIAAGAAADLSDPCARMMFADYDPGAAEFVVTTGMALNAIEAR